MDVLQNQKAGMSLMEIKELRMKWYTKNELNSSQLDEDAAGQHILSPSPGLKSIIKQAATGSNALPQVAMTQNEHNYNVTRVKLQEEEKLQTQAQGNIIQSSQSDQVVQPLRAGRRNKNKEMFASQRKQK